MSALFHGIIGHERALEVLERMKGGNHLAHAFLFVGPDHVGRTLIAKRFLTSFLEGDTFEAHPDAIEVERLVDPKTEKRKTQISVQQIRELRERLAMSAIKGDWKVVFIEEAHLMNNSAANALLKTLEEPSGQTLFILRAPSVSSVPATIASRCQLLRFHLVPRKQIAENLKTTRGISVKEADRIASLSAGCPGRALRYIQDGAYRSEMETAFASTVMLFQSPVAARLKRVQELLPRSEQEKQQVFLQIMGIWEQVIRDMLLQEIGCEDHAIFLNTTKAEETSEQDAAYWMRVLDRIKEARQAARSNVNPQLALEHIVLTT